MRDIIANISIWKLVLFAELIHLVVLVYHFIQAEAQSRPGSLAGFNDVVAGFFLGAVFLALMPVFVLFIFKKTRKVASVLSLLFALVSLSAFIFYLVEINKDFRINWFEWYPVIDTAVLAFIGYVGLQQVVADKEAGGGYQSI